MSSEPDSDVSKRPTGKDELTDRLLDVFVYAPIGLLLDAQTLTPELARRGRQHAAAARKLGELAVKQGLRRFESDRDAPPPDDDGEEAAEPDDVATSTPDRPSADHLAIPDYDLLAASQVVKRLDALDPDELEAVRVYEVATRDRRTILHKISRLQS